MGISLLVIDNERSELTLDGEANENNLFATGNEHSDLIKKSSDNF